MGNSYSNLCGNSIYNNQEVQMIPSILSSSSNMQSTYSRNQQTKSPFRIFNNKTCILTQPKNYYSETYSTNPEINQHTKLIILQRFVKKWLNLLRSNLCYEYFDSVGLVDIDNLDSNSDFTTKKSSNNIQAGNLLYCKTKDTLISESIKKCTSFKQLDFKAIKVDKVLITPRISCSLLNKLESSGFYLKSPRASFASLVSENMKLIGIFYDHSFNGLGFYRTQNCFYKGK